MNTEQSTPAPYVISVDWFQVTCNRPLTQHLEVGLFLNGSVVPDYDKTAIYELARSTEFNPIYEHSLAVLFHGFQLAIIYFDPRPSSLARTLCSVKVSNRLLYSGNWAFYLVDICRALQWKIKNIGRVDVCADFKTFSGNLSPYEFIRRYLHSGPSGSLVPSYIRVGSNKYDTRGEKRTHWNASSKSNDIFHENDYLRFGSRSTGVSVYLYCKSKELAEVHDKPYITQMWIDNGILSQEDLKDMETPDFIVPVFRLEISINAGGLNVKRQRTPQGKAEVRTAIAMLHDKVRPLEVERLSVSDFLCQASIENLFWAYANKYFRFKAVGQSKYKQYWPDVRLFDVQLQPTLKPYTISRTFGTGVAERNAVSAIRRLMETIRDLSLPDLVSLDRAADVLERYSHLTSTHIDRAVVLKVISALREGHTFEELPRMAVCSVVHLEQMKELINESIFHELRELLTDSDVARSVARFEAERAMFLEQSAVVDDFYNQYNE